jgi:hypothetical protein
VRELSHLASTPQNKALIKTLKNDLRSVGGRVLFGLGGFLTTATRDAAAVKTAFLANQRNSTTATQAALLNALTKLQNDATAAQTAFGSASGADQAKLDADLNALAAANPSDTQLQTDVTKSETQLASCITMMSDDVNKIVTDIDKLEADLGGQPIVSGTFSDITFADADWDTVAIQTGLGGTAVGQQVSSGGDLGPYRSVTINVNAATQTGDSQVTVFNGKKSAIWDPSGTPTSDNPNQGAITSVDYSEFAKIINGGGEGQFTGCALMQDGIVYLVVAKGLFTPETTWTPKTQTGLVASDFVSIVNGNLTTQHPDFSATGDPIEFGFIRANSSPKGTGSAYTETVGIDNWAVTVHT